MWKVRWILSRVNFDGGRRERSGGACLWLFFNARSAQYVWCGRLDDGSQSVGLIIPATAPDGKFRNITTNANYRSFTQYAASSPMCLSANQTAEFVEQFPPPVPYPSDQYNAQYTTSYLLGGVSSTIRTASQVNSNALILAIAVLHAYKMS